jgi:Tfp pilus assembly protein PilE
MIELCVVLAVVAVLVATTAILYSGMVRKARMTQARTALKQLQKCEAIHFSEYDAYTDNLDLVGFDPGKYDYYTFSVRLDNGALSYTGFAHGAGAMKGDLWTISPDAAPTHDPEALKRFD